MNENKEIETLAKDLYKKYKPAFDLVFKYAAPSYEGLVPNNLEQLIKEEKSLVPFVTSKTYIRFQPKFLMNNLEKLKEKGFITATDNLASSWIFLFEFHITRTHIYFDIKIGNYQSAECREKVYRLYLDNKDVFNKVERPNGQLSPLWHQVLQRKIVTPEEYSKHLESENENLDKLIEKRFRDIIEKDIPRIEKAFMDVLY